MRTYPIPFFLSLLLPILAARPTLALSAGLPDEDLLLMSDSVALGIAPDGSFINGDLDLGLLWDPDGPKGEIPICGDVLWPGWPFEVWTASWTAGGSEQLVVNGEPQLSASFEMIWDGPHLSSSWTWLHGQAVLDDLLVEEWIALNLQEPLLRTTFRFEALQEIQDFTIARVIDPDLDAAWGSYETVNHIGESVVSAAGSYDDRSIALSAENGFASRCSWCDSPAEVLSGSTSDNTGDSQLGVVVEHGDLALAEQLETTFVYALAVGAGNAEKRALEAALVVDADADGLSRAEGDCEDLDASVGLGSPEIWNLRDDDCDGLVDEGTEGADDDGDGSSEAEGDCDDANATVHPGAAPQQGVVDANCDGIADAGAWPPETDTAVDVLQPGDSGDQDPDDTTPGKDTGEPSEKGGCSSVPILPSSLAALCAALLLLGRARRRVGLSRAERPLSRLSSLSAALLPGLLLSACHLSGGIKDPMDSATEDPTDDTDSPDGDSWARVRLSLETPAGIVLDPKLGVGLALPIQAVAQESPPGERCDLAFEAVDIQGRSRSWGATGLDSSSPVETLFDGLMDDTLPFDPGPLWVQARATCPSGAQASAMTQLYIVRLGVVGVDFQDSGDNSAVTLAYHKLDLLHSGVTVLDESVPEYQASWLDAQELADLDENDGSPRASVPPWTNPDAPPWGTGAPGTLRANLPAGYVVGSQAQLEVTLGQSAVSPSTGLVIPAIPDGAPPIRVVAEGLSPLSDTTQAPTEPQVLLSEPLPDTLGRRDLELTWSFEAYDGSSWVAIPGTSRSTHRLYLLAGQPALRDGVEVGAAPPYPWIGVLDDLDPVLRGLNAETPLILDAIRADLYYDGWIRYDPSDSSYSDYEGSYIYWEYITSDLSSWLDRADGISLYCHSFSCLLSTLAGNVGVNAPQIVLGVGFRTNYMKSAGTDSWARWSFNSHSVVSPDSGGTIWDPSSNLDGDDDPSSEPITELEPSGIDGEEYLWRLTGNDISIVNEGLCYIE